MLLSSCWQTLALNALSALSLLALALQALHLQYGKALKACGLAETVVANTSVTYDPVSASFSSVTIHYNIDGVRHKMTGCRGNVALSCQCWRDPDAGFHLHWHLQRS